MRSPSALVFLSASSAILWGSCALACETRIDLGRNEDTSDDTRDAAGDADSGSSTGVESSCEGACNKLFVCGGLTPPERPRCLAACNAGSTSALRQCIVDTACSQLADRCGVDGFEEDDADNDAHDIAICLDACDVAQFHDCLSAAEHSDCRELCPTASTAARESFVACTRNTATDCPAQQDCWQVFAQ